MDSQERLEVLEQWSFWDDGRPDAPDREDEMVESGREAGMQDGAQVLKGTRDCSSLAFVGLQMEGTKVRRCDTPEKLRRVL